MSSSCPGDPTFRPITGPGGGTYTLAVTSVTQNASTTICYRLSLVDPVPGPPLPPGICHVTIQLFPGCLPPFPPLTVTVDGVPIGQCPPGRIVGTCFEFPGPFSGAPDIFPALKIEFAPSIKAGEAREVCVIAPGCLQTVEGLFRFKAGSCPSFPVDPTCTILTLSCEPCLPKGIPLL